MPGDLEPAPQIISLITMPSLLTRLGEAEEGIAAIAADVLRVQETDVGLRRIAPLALISNASYPVLVHRPASSLHASSPRSVALQQLRFASLTVTSLRRDLNRKRAPMLGARKRPGVARPLLSSAYAGCRRRRSCPQGAHPGCWRCCHRGLKASGTGQRGDRGCQAQGGEGGEDDLFHRSSPSLGRARCPALMAGRWANKPNDSTTLRC